MTTTPISRMTMMSNDAEYMRLPGTDAADAAAAAAKLAAAEAAVKKVAAAEAAATKFAAAEAATGMDAAKAATPPAAPPLYDSQTDYCFKSTTVDQYCWYPTDHFPNKFWTGIIGMGDNNCGPQCNPEPYADMDVPMGKTFDVSTGKIEDSTNIHTYDDTHTRQWQSF